MSRELLAMTCLTQDQVCRECGSLAVSGADPSVGSESDE